MSLRTILISGLLILSVGILAVVGVVGTISIRGSVVEEAQNRVNHDLDTALLLYEQQIEAAAGRLGGLFAVPCNSETREALFADLPRKRRELGFTVLNICDIEGTPLAGCYPDSAGQIPVSHDPILRRALGGDPSRGTVRLSTERLFLEGGPALLGQQKILSPDGTETTDTAGALFQWFAYPLTDANGRIVALAYGGISLHHNFDLVDRMQETIFGAGDYNGKPLGTVTLFLDGVRVATNVVGPTGQRAIGTLVSEEVRSEVLDKGRRWRSRAHVVDAWYLSSYLPLHDPDGEILGMLYVGLLEEPYNDLRARLIRRFLTPASIILGLSVILALLLLPRITTPLRTLKHSARRISAGDWSADIPDEPSISEVTELAAAFRQMQTAIDQRDRELRDKNQTLGQTNDELQKANANYMSTLGFVTHELKSPLAAMQNFIDLLVDGVVGETDDTGRQYLVRIKRNCEELQDMVKDYLDLSRAERGEMKVDMAAINFCSDVADPCVNLATPLFKSRGITLERVCVGTTDLKADAGLLRIALGNFLSNAAKYGREGGKAMLHVRLHKGEIEAYVRNEGEGFTPEEGEVLFHKFSRLKNENTISKRGSGLGLFLTRQILELHGGRVWAESEPGQWARFCMQLPRGNDPD